MKYIITESRLDKVIFKYLDDMLEGVELKKGKNVDIVFLFPDTMPTFPWATYGVMGWDNRGKLYIVRDIISDVKSMFSMDESDDVKNVIGRYIEDRYNLKVRNGYSFGDEALSSSLEIEPQ
jgi:hypothetical protein